MAVRTLQECLDEFVSERHSSRMNTPMLSVGLPTVNAATPHEGRGRCCSEKRESSR